VDGMCPSLFLGYAEWQGCLVGKLAHTPNHCLTTGETEVHEMLCQDAIPLPNQKRRVHPGGLTHIFYQFFLSVLLRKQQSHHGFASLLFYL
jgi:hypothetical protein